MVTFYIDDSGSSDAKDMSQPIFLFSGICIDNASFPKVNNHMEDLIKKSENKIFNKLKNIVDIKNQNHKNNVVDTIRGSLYKKFELHALDLMHGRNENILFSKADKHLIMKSVFDFIKDNDIKVIIVKCDKAVLKSDKTIKDIRSELVNRVMDGLITVYNDYLTDIDQEGLFIFDKGNDIIEHNFKNLLKTKSDLLINPYVIQEESVDSPLIQMADFTAYVANMYFNTNAKNHEELKQYYECISDNVILLDVSSAQTENA